MVVEDGDGRLTDVISRDDLHVRERGDPRSVAACTREASDLESVVGAAAKSTVRRCRLAFGSEGRIEQTLLSDQDNGLVFPSSAGRFGACGGSYQRCTGALGISPM